MKWHRKYLFLFLKNMELTIYLSISVTAYAIVGIFSTVCATHQSTNPKIKLELNQLIRLMFKEGREISFGNLVTNYKFHYRDLKNFLPIIWMHKIDKQWASRKDVTIKANLY